MVNVALMWLLLVPVILSVAVYFLVKKSSSDAIPAAVGSLVAGIMITTITFAIGVGSKTSDTEVWNGQVVNKKREEVHCRHSYDCNCRNVCSGSGKDRSCNRVCDTCYEHRYDVDWDVQTTLHTFSVDTIDRQGIKEPPRWTAVQPGQPVAVTHSYTNYIKGVPESVMHFSSESVKAKFAGKVPAYPLGVYDYHYIDRVLPVGVTIPNLKEWNLAVGNMLRTLGPSKQVNVVIIPTSITDKDYVYAVRDAWLGGKKNDVVIIVSISEGTKINWVHVMSWSDKEIFKVKLRDALQAGEFQVGPFIGEVGKYIASDFQRKHMADFAYLENEIDPPEWLIWLGVMLNFGMCVGVVYFLRKESYGYRSNRRLYR